MTKKTSKQAPAPSPVSSRPKSTPATPWTIEAASRIYKGSAADSGGQIRKGSFAAAAMSEAMKAHRPAKRAVK